MKSRPNQKNTIGVIYARYSSHAQRDCSIEQQVEKAQAFAAARGIRVVNIYADRAVSGKTDRRPAFQRMMADAETGSFNCVIAWKSNRLGRNMLQAMQNAETLSSLGIRCLYVEEEFDDTASGRFALRTMMNVNQFYSENMAEDIRRGLLHSARQGRVLGPVPLGYKKGSDGKYEVAEDEAAVVREIFRRVAVGEAFVDIIEDLNGRGIRTKKGGPWNRSSFHRLLVNEKYVGIYRYADVVTRGTIPQIVPDALFDAAQRLLAEKKADPATPGRRRPGQAPYLLTGKIFCGACKSPMIGVSGTGKAGRSYHYYTCQKKNYEKACKKKNVPRDAIELAVAEAILASAFTDENIAALVDYSIEYYKKNMDQSQIDAARSRIRQAESGIKHILDAVEKGFYNPSMQQRVLDLEAEKRAAECDLAALQAAANIPDRATLIRRLTAFRDAGNAEDKKFQEAVFDSFLMAVYVYDDHVDVVFTAGEHRGRQKVPRSVSEDSECSYKLPLEPLGPGYTNTGRIRFIDGVAVMRIPLKK
ncbi:MAG: recombinase family protein [Oscillospiraceae bacterium]|nr:recombinase family protein [Oscillospiraceae bacterium]